MPIFGIWNDGTREWLNNIAKKRRNEGTMEYGHDTPLVDDHFRNYLTPPLLMTRLPCQRQGGGYLGSIQTQVVFWRGKCKPSLGKGARNSLASVK